MMFVTIGMGKKNSLFNEETWKKGYDSRIMSMLLSQRTREEATEILKGCGLGRIWWKERKVNL